jgi:hypothetical protein
MVLGPVALLAWCLLLFGIGLDDLTNSYTKPGVIFSIVFLALLIAVLSVLAWRTIGRPLRRRLTRH